MVNILVQLLMVCAFAIVAWWITERFSPDVLLTNIVKLVIFICVIAWVLLKLVPRIF